MRWQPRSRPSEWLAFRRYQTGRQRWSPARHPYATAAAFLSGPGRSVRVTEHVVNVDLGVVWEPNVPHAI